MKKKGQLTIFIIIVVVMTVLFGFLFWLTSSQEEQRGETTVTGQRLSQQVVQTIQNYYQGCFENGLESGLELLGKQGGKIFVSQGGLILDPANEGADHFVHQSQKVPFVIVPATGDVGTVYFSQPPGYPWQGFPFTTAGELWTYGYYGKSQLSPLYKNYTKTGVQEQNSLQEQLERYVKNYLISQCTDIDTFEQQGFTITAGAPNVYFDLSQDENFVLDFQNTETLILVADFNIDIKDSATGAGTVIEQFSTSSAVRLSKIYHFVKQLIEQESTDIAFNITGLYPEGFTVSSVNVANNDDLIVVRDPQSTFKGRAFEFQFGRKNRPPALYNIPTTSYTVCRGAELSIVGNAIQTTQNPSGCPSINIALTAMDPDEDFVTYMIKPGGAAETTSYIVPSGVLTLEIDAIAKDGGGLKDWQSLTFTAIDPVPEIIEI